MRINELSIKLLNFGFCLAWSHDTGRKGGSFGPNSDFDVCVKPAGVTTIYTGNEDDYSFSRCFK